MKRFSSRGGRGYKYILSRESELWINRYRKLIDDACYDRKAFDLLIDEIQKYTDSVEERRKIEDTIGNIWDDKNLYYFHALDDGRFLISEAQHF